MSTRHSVTGVNDPMAVVTLLSDFGHEDTFVGQMKGVILSVCSDVTFVDLTHEVPPQDILTGAVHMGAACRWFPAGTIHVAVVDPGVGTDRRAIGVQSGDFVFLAPDNGLLSMVLKDSPATLAVELQRPESESGEISRTFHGRDVFAWAAGQLASGRSLEDVGEPFDHTELMRIDIPEPEIGDDEINGEILFIDHYGNAVTNVPAQALGTQSLDWSVRCREFRVARLSSTYADVDDGAPLAAISSMDTVELGVRNGSASARYHFERGAHVVLRRSG